MKQKYHGEVLGFQAVLNVKVVATKFVTSPQKTRLCILMERRLVMGRNGEVTDFPTVLSRTSLESLCDGFWALMYRSTT